MIFMASERQIKFDAIKLLALDVDGVLTDGGLLIHSDGSETKKFSVLDGHGLKLWQRAGLRVAFSGYQPQQTAPLV